MHLGLGLVAASVGMKDAGPMTAPKTQPPVPPPLLSRDGWFWAGFTTVVGVAWVVLAGLNLTESLVQSGVGLESMSSDLLRWLGAICGAGEQLPQYYQLTMMWVLMAVAMMGPTAVPFVLTYAELGRSRKFDRPAVALSALVIGYLAVWVGFAMVAAGAQHWLQAKLWVDRAGVLTSPWLIAALLAACAWYQVSDAKRACLAKCQNPLMFFLGRWRNGVIGAVNMGARQGLVCAGCCWALMLLAFIGGTMNILWMAGITVVMLVEKLPDARDRIRRGTAGVLMIGAIAVVAYELIII